MKISTKLFPWQGFNAIGKQGVIISSFVFRGALTWDHYWKNFIRISGDSPEL